MNQKKVCKKEALEVLRRCKREFENQYGVTEIGIFGSVARGESKPVSDLDVVIKMQKPDLYYMVHIKEKLEENRTIVLLTSHDLYEIEYLADRVIIMNHGKIVAEGSPSELKRKFGKTVRVILEEPIHNFDSLRETLLEVESVKNVLPIGENSFEVQLKSLEHSINDVLQAITSHRLRIRDIFTTTANFEDIYLDIIER